MLQLIEGAYHLFLFKVNRVVCIHKLLISYREEYLDDVWTSSILHNFIFNIDQKRSYLISYKGRFQILIYCENICFISLLTWQTF